MDIDDRRATRAAILSLAWPVMIANFLQTFTTFVDLLMVGHLGAEEGVVAVSAVGAAQQVLFLNFALMFALSAGTLAVVARSLGAKDPVAASHAAKQALLLGVVLSLPLAAIEFAFAEPILAGITANRLTSDFIPAASAYLRILLLVNPFQFLLFLSTTVLQAAKDTRTPMYVGAAVNVVNFVLNFPLIYGLGPFPRYGVAGAAIGTAVSTAIGASVLVLLLWRGRAGIKLPRGGGFDLGMVRRILRVGGPAGLESLLFQVGLTVWLAMVATLGTTAYAAHTIGLRVQSLAFMPGIGFARAASTLVGQNLGAKAPAEAERSGLEASKLSVLVMCSIGLFNFLAAPWIAAAFTPSTVTQDLTVLFIRIHALSIPAVGLYFALDGALKGAGDTRFPLLTSVVGIFAVRLPLAFALGFVVIAAGAPWWVPLGLTGVWFALPVEYYIRLVMISSRFRAGRWKAARV